MRGTQSLARPGLTSGVLLYASRDRIGARRNFARRNAGAGGVPAFRPLFMPALRRKKRMPGAIRAHAQWRTNTRTSSLRPLLRSISLVISRVSRSSHASVAESGQPP